MRKCAPSLLTIVSFLLPLSHFPLQAENKTENERVKPAQTVFEPFTGRITKDKVRLRIQPHFDGFVLRELNQDDKVIALEEIEDFYAIQPAKDMKAYVFRTFVLDNVIEGTRVNVRLKPDLDAPVIAQFNSGDPVEGVVVSSNNKWLEIPMPASIRFYVAKEYIQKIGDAGLLARLEKRHEDVIRLLDTAHMITSTEMQKPFEKINIDGITINYQHIILNYSDFPEMIAKAKESLAAAQEAYISKKIDYLEALTQQSSHTLEARNKQMTEELKSYRTKVSQLEQQLQRGKGIATTSEPSSLPAISNHPLPKQELPSFPINMSSWFPVEDALFQAWSKKTGSSSLDAFYREQQKEAFTFKGILEPYSRSVKNKPGDYLLTNVESKLPIAFLYSTKVNLQNYVGHEVTVEVIPRSNNHFAFPAYFVLSLELD